jgi:hypothetical protein
MVAIFLANLMGTPKFRAGHKPQLVEKLIEVFPERPG